MDFKRPTPSRPAYDNDTHETLPPPQPHVAAAPVKKTSRGHKFLASFLLILLIAATGYAVYAYMTEQKLRSQLRESDSKWNGMMTINNDLTKKLSDAKAAMATQQKDDKALVAEAATAAATKELKNKGLSVTVEKVENDFASASVKGSGETTGVAYRIILKKSNETWVEIWRGQDLMQSDKTTLNKTYGLPLTF